MLNIIFLICAYLFADLYYRNRILSRQLRLSLLLNDVLKLTLLNKGVIESEEFNKSKEYIFDNMPIDELKKLDKELKKIGINIYKE